MSTRKPRRPNPRHNNNNHNITSDYDTDYPNHLSDAQQQQSQDQGQQDDLKPPPNTRSIEELNLSVLRRHNPCINSIVSIAPYAAVYIFSPGTRQWEKTGVEGTLFVSNLTQGSLGEERYSAFVLNRRGLNNFDIPLTDGENVELTEEYVILKSDIDAGLETVNPDNIKSQNGGNNDAGDNRPGKKGGAADVRIYGLWIYSEPPPNSTAQTRTINAQMIRECAVHAGQSLRIARERLEASQQTGLQMAAEAATTTAQPLEEAQYSVPMDRQISLKDLFGQQRAQDDGWTTRAHHLNPNPLDGWQQQPQPPQQYPLMGMPPAVAQPQPQPLQQQDVLGDLFRRAGLAYQGQGQGFS